MSELLKHEHTCKGCSKKYTHRHPARSADHPQFDFQCPNSECDMFAGKAPQPPSREPETWDEDGELFVWPRIARASRDDSVVRQDTAPSKRSETYKQRTVRLAYESDRITCKIPEHFMMRKLKDGDKFMSPVVRPPLEIIRDMEPFKKASCTCERAACRQAWTWNEPGVLQTEFVANGNYHKGVGELSKDRIKKVMPLTYRLSDAQFKWLHEKFPDYHFVQVKSDGHDHPISHTITQIAAYEMMCSIRKGAAVLDIHGNPSANSRLRKSLGMDIQTVVAKVTAKDYIRSATKWRSEDYIEGPYLRDMSTDVKFSPILKTKDVITSVHTSYYYSLDEINAVLAGAADQAIWVAIMHKFEGESGTLNNGELRWVRDGGDIVQTNVATGEVYRHPDNREWFARDAHCPFDLTQALESAPNQQAIDALQADMSSLAWTKTEVTPGTYRFLAVRVPNKVAWMDLRGDYTKPVWEPKVITTTVAGAAQEFILRPELASFYGECVKMAVYKKRTEKQFELHVGAVKSKAKGIVGSDGARVELDADELAAIIIASFWGNVAKETTTDATFKACAQWYVRTQTAAAEGRHILKADNFVKVALSIVGKALDAKDSRSSWKAVISSIETVLHHT